MRIPGTTNIEAATVNKSVVNNTSTLESVVQQGSETSAKIPTSTIDQVQQIESNAESKTKVQEAVNTLNEMLEVNNSASKFVFHEGLERYYVTVVNKDTDEVVKEIPAKKILDAFYEMQKMLGMIVDEKI